ncbi:GGDEF domain-containing protein [Pseudoneobacillus sp. C159]
MVNINQLNGSELIFNLINKMLDKIGTEKEMISQDILKLIDKQLETKQEKEVVGSIFYQLQQIHLQMENVTWLNKHYKILHDFAQVCSKTLDEDILLNKAYEMVSQVMATDAFYIALYNEGDSHVHFEFIVDNGKFYPKESIEFGENYASEVIKSREIIHLKKAPQSLVYGAAATFGERETSSCLFIPVIIDDHVRGVISAQSYSDFAYRTEHEELLQIIGTQVINSIETARLYEKIYKMSQTDELTGLKNHRAFHVDLSRLMTESDQEITLIMIDSDNLKKVNDNYGHDVGDLYLRVLANGIKSVCGANIEGYRYAGDEFMILITTNQQYEVTYLHESLINFYQNTPIHVANKQFHVSFSTGVATYPHHGKSVDSLKKSADIALYAAKKSGKNQLVLAENMKTLEDKLHKHMYFI